MSTSTDTTQVEENSKDTTQATGRNHLQNGIIILLVLVGGGSTLGIEMTASRLLAPYFGTSLFVWANLIGLILLFLTLGYYFGGRLADRYPTPIALYTMAATGAVLVCGIPLLSQPILEWSLSAFTTYSVGVFYGSLASTIFLFAPSMILLGCISPFAVRLQVDQVGKSGSIAGLLYAISTAGSIAGTFLAVLVLIPSIGTRMTFITFASAILVVCIIGLIVSFAQKNKVESADGTGKPGRPGKFNKGLLSILLLIPVVLTPLGLQGDIKRPSGSGDGGVMLEERESGYNYIQVVRSGDEVQLILNEGLGIHSIYNPNQVITQGPWDYFAVASYFNNAPFTEDQVHSACIIGLGAGTIPRQLALAYDGQVRIDGVEIDGEIVEMGNKYFELQEQPNLNVIVQDGRYHIRTTSERYDIIGLDAYQQPYIPFQLTSVEFLRELKSRLTENGVVVMNVGRTSDDYRLVDAMAENLRTEFPNVYLIDTDRFSNTLLIATVQETNINNFATNTAQLSNPLLKQIAEYAISTGDIREETNAQVHFTDDKAPVEQLIDSIIFNEATGGP